MRKALLRRRTAVGLAGSGALALSLVAVPATAVAQPDDDRPQNVIVLIGDGMGYNHVDLASMYEEDRSRYQVHVDGDTGEIERVAGGPTQIYEHFPVQYAMSTYSHGGSYDPEVMWGDFDASVVADATDSAAAATAMATGVKTTNQGVGVGPDGEELPNVVERAQELGKATGVVTSVVFPHPTTASFAVHHESRLEYLEIADLMVHDSGLNVIMGTGHPWYSDNGDRYEAPDYNYVSEPTWTSLVDGDTPFELIEERADFESLVTAEEPPSHVMGVAQAWTTLQEARGDGESDAPFTDPFIETVPELSEMTLGALNVLDNASEDGFFLAVESGAIDWSSELHAPARVIEEQIALNEAVESVVGWVEEHSSWDDTMVVVTSDHEAGYISGPGANPDWTPMVGAGAGEMPAHTWHRLGHSNQLVPLYAKGSGSEAFAARATQTDPVRGAYLDNTDVGQVILDGLWALPGEEPAPDPEPVPPLNPGAPQFHLSNDWEGATHHAFNFGRVGDEVFIGDWDGDGTDSVAVRRGNVFHVVNEPRGGSAEHAFDYGREGDVILVGDWDGDGQDTFAVRRGNEYFMKNSLTGGNEDIHVRYGRASDEVLVGDWDADGADTLAVRRGNEYFVRNSLSDGNADHAFHYGREADVVLAGDWDGDGQDTLAVRRGNSYYARNHLSAGNEHLRADFGRTSDEVLVGDWDGDGTDTLGILRTPS